MAIAIAFVVGAAIGYMLNGKIKTELPLVHDKIDALAAELKAKV